MPIDSFGRKIDYLRISLIDHCNLRCVYCMPLHDVSPSRELLRAEEIEAIVQAAAAVGFRKVRLTGGEPMLRSDLVEIIERISRIEGIRDVAMTTNGIGLPGLAGELAQAGLRRVNVHLDSLNRENLSQIMRFASFDQIWAGIEAAEEAGLNPIKLNCVVTRGYNDEDVVDLARLTLERDWYLRFIELMPFGEGECAALSRDKLVKSRETKERIERELGSLTPLAARDIADESRNYRLENARGVIGFISPVSEPYCDTCNRMRLTADGKLHLCLLNDDEIDMRPVLRNGRSQQSLEELITAAVEAKPVGHHLDRGVSTRLRIMHQLGG